MKVLDGAVDTESPQYKANYEAMQTLIEQLDSKTKEAMFVDTKYRELAKKRDKLLPRERINAILDPGTPFLEMS